jgi:FkbM family methyltransferase
LPNVNRLSTKAKRILARSAMTLLGRRNLVRLGRFISNEARLDLPNEIGGNGERLVQRLVLNRTETGEEAIVFDVGANIGKWTQSLLQQLSPGVSLQIHLFEPCAATFETLSSNISNWPLGHTPVLNNLALSSRDGFATLYSHGANRGTNSLYVANDDPAIMPEEIRVEQCDSYCERNAITHIHLLKIDAEGHDMEVILGARRMLEAGRIEALQFEYNWRWVDARRFLKDAFEFLQPFGYHLGKVTPSGVEFYNAWDFELETFREANFVALRPGARRQLPEIQWWKS